MTDDDEEAIVIGDGPEPDYEYPYQSRVTPSGRPYRIPDPNKKVIHLEEDCGLLLEDVEFLRHMPGLARFYLDGDPFLNAEWKRKNLIPFRRRWRPRFQLPKSSN
jgi:hypothetical protein